MSKIASTEGGSPGRVGPQKFPAFEGADALEIARGGGQASVGRQNMSLGGARVFSDDKLKIGTKLNLELLAGPDSTVQVLARVAWIDEPWARGPARFDVGLEFLDVPEEMMSRLAAILKKDEDYKRQMETPAPRDPVWEDDEEDGRKEAVTPGRFGARRVNVKDEAASDPPERDSRPDAGETSAEPPSSGLERRRNDRFDVTWQVDCETEDTSSTRTSPTSPRWGSS